MTDKALNDALNAAGAALKATGEERILLGYYARGDMDRPEDGYSIRVDCPGSSGVHGFGKTPAEAYRAAMNQRVLDAQAAELEAQIRAEVEERLAALGRQEAA